VAQGARLPKVSAVLGHGSPTVTLGQRGASRIGSLGPQFQSPLPSPTVTDSHQPNLGTLNNPNTCHQRSSTLIYGDRLGDQEGLVLPAFPATLVALRG
jgi:hypothetical protein